MGYSSLPTVHSMMASESSNLQVSGSPQRGPRGCSALSFEEAGVSLKLSSPPSLALCSNISESQELLLEEMPTPGIPELSFPLQDNQLPLCGAGGMPGDVGKGASHSFALSTLLDTPTASTILPDIHILR